MAQDDLQRTRDLQDRASPCRKEKTPHSTPTGPTTPAREWSIVPATSQSTHILGIQCPTVVPLASLVLPQSSWRTTVLLFRLSIGGVPDTVEGREESPIVP